MRAYSGIDTCIGGLRTNHRLEVLNKNLYPIKGLFAAGVVIGNWLGVGYSFMGSNMSFTTYSGYAVGKIAAEYVKSIN
jgi:succinate dehydrogenase/fumarate reductase flavoprotein subunit